MGKDVGYHDVVLAIWVCPNCSKYILRAAFKRADAALNFYSITIPILCQQLKQIVQVHLKKFEYHEILHIF